MSCGGRLLIDTHGRLAGVLRRWGGEVGQFLGDGLLCYFGARGAAAATMQCGR